MPTKPRRMLLALAAFGMAASGSGSFREEQWKFPRVRVAGREKDDSLRRLFAAKNLDYPPGAILLRAFKEEGQLELWVATRSGPYALANRYPICAASGVLGPKRRGGDEQVPEGFYTLDWFNPESNFYLSLHISYPNQADRVLGSRQNPGGNIFLHGNCVTLGCIPITDDGIKEVYWLAVLARASGQKQIPIEIFPARLTDGGLDRLAPLYRTRPELLAFWQNLKEGFDAFEKHRKPPRVSVDRRGRYVFAGE
jgi:murein L,D-transpeptidase YafK